MCMYLRWTLKKFGYQKCIDIGGLKIEISRYIWCMDTVAIWKNDIFSLLGHFLRVIDTQSNVVFLCTIPQNKIN